MNHHIIQTNENQTILQAFEWYLPAGGHWNRLREEAPKLAKAGFTTLWLPPAYKGLQGRDDVGYGVYDTYDLGEFDQKGSVATKYGTRSEYLAAIRALHKNGLKVWADIVLNHRLGGDAMETIPAEVVEEGNRDHPTGETCRIRAWTRFDFPGRGDKYSSFHWNWQDFNGIDWDEKRKRRQVYRFRGKRWNKTVDTENGNYDYLMGANLDMGDAKVVSELKRWGRWYLGTTGVDGFRLDAVKHIRFSFFTEWLDCLRSWSGRELPAVGEYWSAECSRLLAYLEECRRCTRLFDVPLHFAFQKAAQESGNFDMSLLRSGSLWEAEADSAVTFVDNHDTQPGQALQSWVAPWFKPMAYALILLQQGGIPCVFWGDWVGIPHDNIPSVKELPILLQARRDHAYGQEHAYFDHPDLVGLTRQGDRDHEGLALLMSDRDAGEKEMFVGRRYAGREFTDILGNIPGTVTIASDGSGRFRVGPGSLSVWVPKAA